MAQEVISSAILIIAGVIATIALVNAVYPSLFTATDSVHSVSGTASDRVKTDVRIAMASQPNASALYVWVKNVGSTEIPASQLGYTDVYFGDSGSMARADTDGHAAFHWSYVLDDIDGDGSWGPGETLQVLISDQGSAHLTAGTHDVKLVLYNSASVADTVTI
jgi:archaeal flagellar protein FlaG